MFVHESELNKQVISQQISRKYKMLSLAIRCAFYWGSLTSPTAIDDVSSGEPNRKSWKHKVLQDANQFKQNNNSFYDTISWIVVYYVFVAVGYTNYQVRTPTTILRKHNPHQPHSPQFLPAELAK